MLGSGSKTRQAKNRCALLAVAYGLVGLLVLSRSLPAVSVLRLSVLYGSFINV